jgi:hypothetical protein
MGKKRLNHVKETQGISLVNLNPHSWKHPKHDKGTIKNRSNRFEKLHKR